MNNIRSDTLCNITQESQELIQRRNCVREVIGNSAALSNILRLNGNRVSTS